MSFFNRIGTRFKISRLQELRGSWLMPAAALSVFILVAYQTAEVIKKRQSIGQEITGLELEIKEKQKLLAALQKDLQKAGTHQMIEKIAKAELNLQKPGEEVAVVIPAATSSLPDSMNSKSYSIWQRLKKFFTFGALTPNPR